jgi:transposase
MIYASIEYQIRKARQENNASFPDMNKKLTQKPTAKWVFFCFQGVSFLTIVNIHHISNDLKAINARD